MRLATLVVVFTTLAVALPGCGDSKAELRPEPVEVKGTVKLPGNVSAKDMTVTFQPQQNTPPGGSKIGTDASFTVKLIPGKYSVYFTEEANAKMPGYKAVPQSYRSPSDANVVSIDSAGQVVNIDVK